MDVRVTKRRRPASTRLWTRKDETEATLDPVKLRVKRCPPSQRLVLCQGPAAPLDTNGTTRQTLTFALRLCNPVQKAWVSTCVREAHRQPPFGRLIRTSTSRYFAAYVTRLDTVRELVSGFSNLVLTTGLAWNFDFRVKAGSASCVSRQELRADRPIGPVSRRFTSEARSHLKGACSLHKAKPPTTVPHSASADVSRRSLHC